MIRYDLPKPIKAVIAEMYLYDMDETKTAWVPCKVFAIDAYPGEALTVTVLLDDGAMFNYIPLDAVMTKVPEEGASLFPYADLVYNNCIGGKVAVTVHEALKQPAWAYFKNKQQWIGAEFVCCLDFYEGNDLMNFLILENGQFAALPNHKVKFGATAPKELPQYKKLRQVWKV
jgi:hypothetical protein